MEDTKYYSDVLIKLRRKYSKDDAVSLLNKKISELETYNGELISEVDHLNSEIEKIKTNYKSIIEIEIEKFLSKYKNAIEANKEIEYLKNRVSKLQIINEELASKICKMKNKK